MKKFLSILLICVFLLALPLCVYAEESNMNSYYVNALVSYGAKQSGGEYRGYYYDYEFSIDKKLVGYLATDSNGWTQFNTILYDSSGINYQLGMYLHDIKYRCNFSLVPGGNTKFGDYTYNSGNYNFVNLKDDLTDDFYLMFRWRYGIGDSGFLNTNIPYFATYAEALAYINGEISVESALNYTSVLQTITDSDEVPTPKNLRIEYDKATMNYYLMWEYNPEDLEKLMTIAVTGMDKDFYISERNLNLYHVYADDIGFDVSLDEYLEPRLSYKFDITDDVKRLRNRIEEVTFNHDYRCTLDYWVMGSYKKSSTELHIGKLAHVELLLDSSDKGFIVDTNNYYTDSNGNVLDDVIFDTNIDYEDGYISGGSNGFFGNLTSAFGLIGENGFLACCKAIFACFPSFIWDLFGLAIEAAIVVFLFKLLFA